MLKRNRDRRVAVLGAVLAAALALTACGGTSKHPQPVTTPQTATVAPPIVAPRVTHGSRKPLISIVGAASQLLQNPAATLQTLKALGVQDVRIDVRWNALAPSPTATTRPAAFNASDPASYPAASWAPLDQAIAAAHADGIGVLATVGGPAPLWAEQPGDPNQAGEPQGVWKPDPAAFGEFVKAVATRYTGSYKPIGAAAPLPRIALWSVWNEPNYGQDLAPQAIDHSTVEVSPAFYRGLLNAGWTALHSVAHGPETVLFGEIAPRGQTVGNVPGNFGGMVPLRFLRALYCVNSSFQRLSGTAATQRGCPSQATTATAAAFRAANPALFRAGGLAAHLYPQGVLAPTARATALPGFADFAEFASLPELESTLAKVQAAYGSHRPIPIYNTEFGFQTDPPEPSHLHPALAATYMNQAEYLSWRDPHVRSFDQYLLSDPPPVPGRLGFDTGLEFSDSRPKATFFAFRMPIYMPVTTATAHAPLEVWGCARPAPAAATQTHTAQHVLIQFKPAAPRSRFTPVRTVTLPRTSCYFDVRVDLPQSGTVRLKWSPPGGGADFSRDIPVTVR
jgi:hypothetical protein